MKNKKIPRPDVPILHVNKDVSLEEQITQRAHELWQQRGRGDGNDLGDWLQAEREVNAWHQQLSQGARLPRR